MSTKADPYSKDDEMEMEDYSWSRADEIKETIHTLVSHHPPSLYSHCLRVSILGRSIYFCSRCSGIYGGMGLGLAGLFLLDISLQPRWLWFMIALILGFSTVTDWMTQRLAPRKTRNSVRFLTGLMAGVGLSIVFMLADLLYMLLTLGIMVASVGLVGLLENRLKDVSQLYDDEIVDVDDTEKDDTDVSED
ncbi:MAG: DUF2085 domain-containing protein [Candidatus Thorarchaeota archaeon]|nr:DUF2085 domain-containing protein [Candidatus Thorarchaeota archaeon]